MKNSRKEKITLFVRYGLEEPKDIIDKLRKVTEHIDIDYISDTRRPLAQFPFIKDEKGRPYYGKEGILFYIIRKYEEIN